MRNSSYFDTFPATIAASCENFVFARVLVGIWNAPIVGTVVIWSLMMVWQRRAEMRRQLGSLDRTLLRDMGITVSDAGHEAAKPFWRT